MELTEFVGPVELVRVWILTLISEGLDPVLSVLSVLSGIHFLLFSFFFGFFTFGSTCCWLLGFLRFFLPKLLSSLDLTKRT